MSRKPQPKPKKPPGHADPDEYARFLKVAEEVGASDDPADFDEAFEKLAHRVTQATPKDRS